MRQSPAVGKVDLFTIKVRRADKTKYLRENIRENLRENFRENHVRTW